MFVGVEHTIRLGQSGPKDKEIKGAEGNLMTKVIEHILGFTAATAVALALQITARLVCTLLT